MQKIEEMIKIIEELECDMELIKNYLYSCYYDGYFEGVTKNIEKINQKPELCVDKVQAILGGISK